MIRLRSDITVLIASLAWWGFTGAAWLRLRPPQRTSRPRRPRIEHRPCVGGQRHRRVGLHSGERSIGDGPLREIAKLRANVVRYTNSNLASGATFFYRVKAIRKSVSSAYSNVAERHHGLRRCRRSDDAGG